jgi:uncharacterized protein (DUF3084 family)
VCAVCGSHITTISRECADLQHYWLRAQTELVALSKDHQDLFTQLSIIKGQYTIMTQKQMRLNSKYHLQYTDKKQLADGF